MGVEMETTLNGFDEFWTAYPRRVGKLAAIKAYKRALKLTTPEVLLSGAKKYAHERSGQDSTFTAHPATWLNGGKWDAYAVDLTRVPEPRKLGETVYVPFDAPEMDAWLRYERETRKSYPRDKKGGWWFPSRLPPQHEAQA